MERRLNLHKPFDGLMVLVLLAAIVIAITDYLNHTNIFGNVEQASLLIALGVYIALLIALAFRFDTYHIEQHKYWTPPATATVLVLFFVGIEQGLAFALVTILMYATFSNKPEPNPQPPTDPEDPA